MASNYPYMSNSANIKAFLQFIQGAGIPEKVTQEYLTKAGFKSTNDRPLIPLLKFVQFLNASGSPTEKWQHYRGDQRGIILADGIRSGYSDLFAIYPNAQDKDNEALRNFFSSSTKVGAATVDYMVRTFKTLCENADFKSTGTAVLTPVGAATTVLAPQGGATTTIVQTTQKPGCVVNINIQLTLPDSAKPETYDAFFEAMKKHLLQ